VSVSSSVLQLTVMLRDVTFAKHALSAWPITTHWSSRNRVTDRLGFWEERGCNHQIQVLQTFKHVNQSQGPKNEIKTM